MPHPAAFQEPSAMSNPLEVNSRHRPLRSVLRAAAAFAAAAMPAMACAGFNYGVISYTDIADTFATSAYSQVLSFPAINNAGQVAFSALTRTNVQHVYVTPLSGSAFINVADTANGFTGMSYFTLNNAGTAVFSATSSTGANANHTGIFSGNGGAITTVADSTTSSKPYYSGGTPRISDAGSSVFTGTGVGGTQQITVQKNGAYTAVATNNGGTFEYLYDAAINSSGQVAFITDDYSTGNNNGAFIYRANAGGSPVKIARAFTSTSVAINDAGVIAFEAAVGNGNGFPPTGIATTDGVTTTFISQLGQFLPGTNILINSYAANGQGTPINNAGLVALQGSDSTLANYGIYVGDGANTQTIVRVGQSLFGKTVKDFGLGRDAINDNGQVAFSVVFTDNTSAVVLTSGVSPVPEPGTAALLSLGGLAGLALRRRLKESPGRARRR
jgi:hypothetical protein